MVKATIRHKNLTELEGDVILGTAILYGATENSETFIIGDVERSNIPVILAANAGTPERNFFGKRAGKIVCRFLYGISYSCGSNTGGGF